jgi:hypothetical protein
MVGFTYHRIKSKFIITDVSKTHNKRKNYNRLWVIMSARNNEVVVSARVPTT